MKVSVAATLSALVFASITTSAYAQDANKAKSEESKDSQVVETITVTTGSRAAKAVDKIPGAITVISKEEIVETPADARCDGYSDKNSARLFGSDATNGKQR
ncbi:MAG: hypothetical protein IPP88_22715 [Betaproteobacteria bacterium]|nr:hypothetical protein [Betaproteobacteria bacterium]